MHASPCETGASFGREVLHHHSDRSIRADGAILPVAMVGASDLRLTAHGLVEGVGSSSSLLGPVGLAC